MKYLLPLLLLLTTGNINAQDNFTCTPEFVQATKPANNFVFYDYTQFENLTNDSLEMRWVLVSLIAPDGHGGIISMPDTWEIGIQDPTNSYIPANGIDSADFVLPPVTGSIDKFIFQVYPNETEGQVVATYKFFPLNDPTDITEVTFDFTAAPFTPDTTNTNLEAIHKNEKITLYPNPTTSILQIETQENIQSWSIYDTEGKLVKQEKITPQKKTSIPTHNLPPNTYLLKCETTKGSITKKFHKK